MIITFLRKYKNMILISILFFYLGCGITISFIQMDCVDVVRTENSHSVLNNIEYAILIMSGPDNDLKRDTVRTTWCKFINNILIENGERLYKWNHTWSRPIYYQNDFAKCFFVIGTKMLSETKLSKLKAENNKSKDILFLENLEDNYNSLARKLIMSLQWFNDNLKKLKYVVKCDDDSFVRIDLIIRDLDAFAPEMNAPAIQEFVSSKVCDFSLQLNMYLIYKYIKDIKKVHI